MFEKKKRLKNEKKNLKNSKTEPEKMEKNLFFLR